MKFPVVTICRCCGHDYDVVVDVDGYDRWRGGELIQNALPELSTEDREMLISGTCDVCWNMLLPEDFEEQGLTFPVPMV